jgi:hypothetical protein
MERKCPPGRLALFLAAWIEPGFQEFGEGGHDEVGEQGDEDEREQDSTYGKRQRGEERGDEDLKCQAERVDGAEGDEPHFPTWGWRRYGLAW